MDATWNHTKALHRSRSPFSHYFRTDTAACSTWIEINPSTTSSKGCGQNGATILLFVRRVLFFFRGSTEDWMSNSQPYVWPSHNVFFFLKCFSPGQCLTAKRVNSTRWYAIILQNLAKKPLGQSKSLVLRCHWIKV